MTTSRWMLYAGCLALTAAPAWAQDRPQDATRRPGDTTQGTMPRSAANWTTLERVMDGTFVLGSATTTRDAAGNVQTRDDKKKGEIEDVVVDTKSGDVRWAVISTGDLLDDEKTIVVPWSKLKQRSMGEDGDELLFTLDLAPERLRSAPPFDLDKAKDDNTLQSALRSAESTWNDMVDDVKDGVRDATSGRDPANPRPATEPRGTDPNRNDPDRPHTTDPNRNDPSRTDPRRNDPPLGTPETGEGAQGGNRGTGNRGTGMDASAHTGAGTTYVLGSKLKGMDLKTTVGEDKDFGEVSQVIVNADKGCVDYVVASEGGVLGIGETDYLIPFKAGRVTRMKADEDPVLQLSRSTKELENAIKYKKPDNDRMVLDATMAQRADQFFGVQHDAKDGMKKDAGGVRRDGMGSGK